MTTDDPMETTAEVIGDVQADMTATEKNKKAKHYKFDRKQYGRSNDTRSPNGS